MLKCWKKKVDANNRVYYESKDGKVASAEKVINTWFAVTGDLKKQDIDYSPSKQSAIRKIKKFMKKNNVCKRV